MDHQQKSCVIAAIVITLAFTCIFIFMNSDYYKDNYPSVVSKQSNTQPEQVDCTVIIKMLQNESYTIVWEGSIEEYYSCINSAEANQSVMNSSDDIQITINCNGVI